MFDVNRLLSNRDYVIYSVIIAIAIALILYFGIPWSGTPAPLHYSGTSANITVAKALALSSSAANSSSISIIPGSNKIIFSSKNVSVVILNINAPEAVAITNSNATRYHGDVLAIYGLIYPTIIMPDNATLNVTFINLAVDGNCGVFVNYLNPAFNFEATPSSLYNSSTFKTPLLQKFNAPLGIAQAAYAPDTPLGHFNTFWYMSSCSSNVTYGNAYNGALYR